MRRLLKVAFISIAVAIAAFAWANVPFDTLPDGTTVDRIVVWKSKRQMEFFAKGSVLKRYTVSLGGNPTGHKQQEGDQRTPEGIYKIALHNPHSTCHVSLKVSYPSPNDTAAAEKLGVSPGGDIMIHGLPNGFWFVGRFHRFKDWTAGCIAVTDPEMEEIFRVVPDGTPIEIHP
jgi:murein L,D-transpeptidase YafK